MQRFQHCDQPVFVDDFLFRGQCFVGLQFFQHVVHAGQCEVGVLRLLAFTVGVELFGEVADAGFVAVF